jgi:hypothetical protein
MMRWIITGKMRKEEGRMDQTILGVIISSSVIHAFTSVVVVLPVAVAVPANGWLSCAQVHGAYIPLSTVVAFSSGSSL